MSSTWDGGGNPPWLKSKKGYNIRLDGKRVIIKDKLVFHSDINENVHNLQVYTFDNEDIAAEYYYKNRKLV